MKEPRVRLYFVIVSNLLTLFGIGWVVYQYVFQELVPAWHAAEIWLAALALGLAALIALIYWLWLLMFSPLKTTTLKEAQAMCDIETVFRRPFYILRFLSINMATTTSPLYKSIAPALDQKFVDAIFRGVSERIWLSILMLATPWMLGSNRLSDFLKLLPGGAFLDAIWGGMIVGVFVISCFYLALWLVLGLRKLLTRTNQI